jgi:hypothetical protein
MKIKVYNIFKKFIIRVFSAKIKDIIQFNANWHKGKNNVE